MAIGALIGSVVVTSAEAQTLRDLQPPAEFPPASFSGNQYVDSRGCVYIRAGIDGSVTWVPRVSRDRRQVCGAQPTAVAGTTSAPPQARPPAVITLAPAAPQPAAPAVRPAAAAPVARPAASVPAAPARTAAVPPAPVRTPAAPPPARASYRPATTSAPVTAPAPAPRTTSATAPIAPRPASGLSNTGCPGASPLSQKYINRQGVRCGPQAEPPITYGRGWESSGATLPPGTRVVPRHVYDNRQNTTNVSVPPGYRSVWKDDRLNPHRAERTLAPSVIRATATVPPGYRLVQRDDDRLNPLRGARDGSGDAQTDLIWSRGTPRILLPVATAPRVVSVPKGTLRSPAEAPDPTLLRLSTRSDPAAPAVAAGYRVPRR